MFQPVRGTHDLLPKEYLLHNAIVERARDVCALYGYEQMSTPIFEFSGVFQRLGETSDVVTKETYTFNDRGGESLTLRPEGTAAVVRAIISNGLTQQLPLKFFSAGPMFRYDRPQKGRQRQFHQITVELLGVSEPLGDVESIAMAAQILESLGIAKKAKLFVNTLGDTDSRNQYRKILVQYLKAFEKELSEDSKERLYKNPLRILDSKDSADKKIVANAPLFKDHLTAQAEDFFAKVLKGLDEIGINYEIDSHLVRGLDYYCHTAFEFRSDELGAQSQILGGGRYDGLVKAMGGPEIAGIGWAAGIERLMLLTQIEAKKVPIVAVIPIGEAAEATGLKLTQELRNHNIAVDIAYAGNLPKRFKRADKIQARFAIIIGEEELKNNQYTVKDLSSGEQTQVVKNQLASFLNQHLTVVGN